ncbi:MAG: bifunctional phosphopantothenoylcysteine decarboxylase/phosphopantothenate--cysteine ligase CoaBC [Robiginitomaculum sp.]|nr:bifunctional phosphopantothenoylcysteine decarboxylase/phosphopantothenate--cysteine ligase CoaBC [Robiginitomaculum sp.]
MHSKNILLIIGGGIAAYKSLELIRLLAKDGFGVRAICTQAGTEFVTPLSISALTGEKVFTDLFDLTDEAEMGHIQLSRSADLLVVAPATADLMAKMAHGLANDLASTCLLATDQPVLLAPAMNVRMWEHAATKRNVKTLLDDGVQFVGPNAGDMACGEFGPGRMAEPEEILTAIKAQLGGGPLTGKSALVTAGPTHEPIDPVRYLANRSSGKQGFAVAEALAALGADVTLISGPVNITAPSGVKLVQVETACEMLRATENALPVDVAVFAAAVADWRTDAASCQKIKKQKGKATPELCFTENPDILATVSALPKNKRPQLVIGFAAETEQLIEHATQKRLRKKCDWIVANDVSGDVMGADHNQVVLIRETDMDPWPKLSKKQTAQKLAAAIADELSETIK